MKDNPTYKLTINGYTDNRGNAAANKVLSNKRAIAVMKYLQSHGIDGSRLSANGYGQDSPVADNNTEEGRMKNRRVELKVSF
jgi:outer membrane protein OmpA-like peptidoglycan-associated protein